MGKYIKYTLCKSGHSYVSKSGRPQSAKITKVQVNLMMDIDQVYAEDITICPNRQKVMFQLV